MSDEMEILPEAKGTEAPKKRGRPRKVREVPIDGEPEEIIEKGPKPKRGRKPKGIDEGVLSKQLVGLHLIAAEVLKMPEIAIDQDEAELLANAISGIAKEYNLAVSGKTAAWLGLAGAAAMVYAPRAIVIAKKMPKRKGQPSAVPMGPMPRASESAHASAVN